MPLAIGVDVGGTKVAAGVVDDDGRLVAETRCETPSESDTVLDAVVSVVSELRDGRDVEAVGVGVAGYVDAERSTMLFAPNLPWENVPVRARLEDALGCAVVVENDANSAAWAEYRYGAGQGEPDLVCLTVGTGIGCGIVLDGVLYRGRFGIAGEPGHVCVERGGVPCGCGNEGCLEQYASGTALSRYASGRSGEAVTAAARGGEREAVAAFARVGMWLGRGLADLAAVLDPGLFVIGGGVADAGELLLGPTRESFAASLSGAAHRPHADVRLAALGNTAGLVGAADLARSR
jgi:glucokinase